MCFPGEEEMVDGGDGYRDDLLKISDALWRWVQGAEEHRHKVWRHSDARYCRSSTGFPSSVRHKCLTEKQEYSYESTRMRVLV
jgi:hypothetical protein